MCVEGEELLAERILRVLALWEYLGDLLPACTEVKEVLGNSQHPKPTGKPFFMCPSSVSTCSVAMNLLQRANIDTQVGQQ